ncbi:bifunctional phosphopantothenoylcysteine decarboxylase/phosphopantothenate--cysteine ligase CoaBC [Alkalicoccus luteus]|uniref:Coenzyme A biosynthesis bifunctional protein CoaBC n=1 Tax=Alkalicoccus luteus TaxID=1237094 RepID=A0A969PRW1_9BACI|nr:bifunctional phosphopantothenoylcysteine decarboxylase/phosphopantothenate--cysteine ligase CoaBC [Alkalicoccus luteus]
MKGKKRVLLAVSGGIAAFKAAALTSRLVQADYEVKVMMTKNALNFIGEVTFQALSRNPVYTDTFIEPDPEKIAHIDVADWADIIFIAPASADVIARLANGLADDMVSTTIMASTAPKYIAPAMNVHMYANPAVQRNMQRLVQDGYQFVEPDEGYLACGYTGKGRMAEPEDLHAMIDHHFIRAAHPEWHGKRVVITAGPTQEVIDPVRFLSNRSSGKMGFSLAAEAAARGADVTLVAGPVSLDTPHGVNRINVQSAEEMYKAVMNKAEAADVVIKAAAVSDYKPAEPLTEKMKKSAGSETLHMIRTADILAELGTLEKKPVLIGFAAESENVEDYAREKLRKKNVDAICANSVVSEGSGFQVDTNSLDLFFRDGTKDHIPLMSKADAAKQILNHIPPLWVNRYDR